MIAQQRRNSDSSFLVTFSLHIIIMIMSVLAQAGGRHVVLVFLSLSSSFPLTKLFFSTIFDGRDWKYWIYASGNTIFMPQSGGEKRLRLSVIGIPT